VPDDFPDLGDLMAKCGEGCFDLWEVFFVLETIEFLLSYPELNCACRFKARCREILNEIVVTCRMFSVRTWKGACIYDRGWSVIAKVCHGRYWGE
jgi:hypothetical protein